MCTTGMQVHTIDEGIVFYPMRYVLIDDNIHENTHWGFYTPRTTANQQSVFSTSIGNPQGFEITIATPQDFPEVRNKKYGLSLCKSGYLYVIDETDNVWYEYEILESGRLHKCHWTDESFGSDYRPANSITKRHLSFNSGRTYHFAYSEVQWSWSYYQRLAQSQSRRSEKMQYIDVSRYVNGTGTEHAFSGENHAIVLGPRLEKGFTDLSVAVTPYIENLTSDIDARFEANRNQTNLHNWHYLGIVDPFGLADQLTEDLNNNYKLLELTIQSTQVGYSPTIIARDVEYGQDATSIVTDNVLLEQMLSLNKMAQILYQVGFSSPDMHDMFGKHLDRPLIEKLLAVQERETVRKEIGYTKREILLFLKSSIYKNCVELLMECSPSTIFHGKTRFLDHIRGMGVPCDGKDKMWSLHDEYQREYRDFVLSNGSKKAIDDLEHIETYPSGFALSMDWHAIRFLEEVISEAPTPTVHYIHLVELFFAESTIPVAEFLPGMSNELATRLSTEELIAKKRKTGWDHVANIDKVTGFFFKTIEIFGTTWQKTNDALDAVIDGLNTVSMEGYNLDHFFQSRTPQDYFASVNGRYLDFPDNLSLNDIVAIDFEDQMLLGIRDDFLDSSVNSNQRDIWRKASKIMESPHWQKAMYGLAIVNIIITVKAATKPGAFQNNDQRARQITAMVGASSQMIELCAKSFHKAALEAGTRGATSATIAKVAGRANAAASFATAGISLLDCYANIFEGDIDAGIAYGVSGICGVLTGLVSIGVINSWNPVGVIALVAAGIIAGFVAVFLEDSPLEVYVKNCPLNQRISRRAIDLTQTTTVAGVVRVFCLQSNRNLLQQTNFWTDPNYENWYDFTIAIRDLEIILNEQQTIAQENQ